MHVVTRASGAALLVCVAILSVGCGHRHQEYEKLCKVIINYNDAIYAMSAGYAKSENITLIGIGTIAKCEHGDAVPETKRKIKIASVEGEPVSGFIAAKIEGKWRVYARGLPY